MKTGIILASLAAALLALPAHAQQQGGGRQRAAQDCSKAADPAACTAHREARKKMAEACKGKSGAERRQCHNDQMQRIDCSKARNPDQCEARKRVYGECKDQSGPAFKQCVRQKMPPADCSKSPNAAQCDLHARARETCKDKAGPEHRACVTSILTPAK